MKKTKVAVIFGSKSVEHEVSVVTAMQIMVNLDKKKYEIIPVYIDKTGKWWSGKTLLKLGNYKNLELKNRIGLGQYSLLTTGEKKLVPVGGVMRKAIDFDIALAAVHGTFGEDGTLQGLLEMTGIPYTGCGVTAAAVGMDKVIQKNVFEKNGLPIVKYEWFTKEDYGKNKKEIIAKIEKNIGYPVFVKPANLGSSVGINKAKNRKELEWAIDVASEFDTRLLVEEGMENIDEINVSVMGNNTFEASVCEQPITGNKFLSYADKYMSGSKVKGMANLSRLIPAPISNDLTEKILNYAITAFKSIGASGVARIDFLVDIKAKKVFINEINTLPGSVSYYLWEKTGYTFAKMLDKLIELGFERFDDRNKLMRSYDSGLLKNLGKGSKV